MGALRFFTRHLFATFLYASSSATTVGILTSSLTFIAPMTVPVSLPRHVLLRLRSQSKKFPLAGVLDERRGKWHVTNFAHGSNAADDPTLTPTTRTVDNPMAELEAKILDLLAGQAINVNSPKQVSSAIFGRVRSVNRDVLQQAADGQFQLTSTQQQLAALVLQHRLLSRGPTGPAKDSNARPRSQQTRSRENLDDTPRMDDGLQTSARLPSNAGQNFLADKYETQVGRLFQSGSKIHQYWREPLLELTRPTARALLAQLDPTQCPMGFDPLASPSKELSQGSFQLGNPASLTSTIAGKKGTFLAYCRDEKEKYPDAIVLTRCTSICADGAAKLPCLTQLPMCISGGDFYETYGVDAIMLVEHCGLNSMAGKAKAGCPIRNVQATLDCRSTQHRALACSLHF